MKDCIRELAEQAGFNISNDPIDGHDFKYEIEKFAELIVRECINATGNCAGTGDMIKEHFGIDVPPVSLRPVTIEEALMSSDKL